jgi:hypothetical protein
MRPAIFRALSAGLVAAGIAACETPMTVKVTSNVNPPLPSLLPRSLSPGATVCINPPLNLTRIEISRASDELANRIRQAGFVPGVRGALPSCDATLFTEITGHSRKTVDLEFRIVLRGEQVPRLCSTVVGKREKLEDWNHAVLTAFAAEVNHIRKAQTEGMALYGGALQ